jgi:hypothetical protein
LRVLAAARALDVESHQFASGGACRNIINHDV